MTPHQTAPNSLLGRTSQLTSLFSSRIRGGSARRASRPRPFQLESLENRSLLAFTVLDSAITLEDEAATFAEVRMSVEPTDSTATGNVTLAIQAFGASTNSIADPGSISVLPGTSGTTTITPLSSQDNVDGGTRSFVTVSLAPGEYRIRIPQLNDTAVTGSQDKRMKVEVMLAGDRLGAGAAGVVSDFEQLRAGAAWLQAQGGGNFVTQTFYRQRGIDLSQNLYSEELDVNRNGVVDGTDVRQIDANHAVGAVTVDLQSDVDAPAFTNFQLTQDTGSSNTDRISTNVAMQGTVIDADGAGVEKLEARIDGVGGSGAFVDITDDAGITAAGNFTISRTVLDRIFGGTLSVGRHTIELLATDTLGNRTPTSDSEQLVFTLIGNGTGQNVAPTGPTTLPDQTAEAQTAFSLTLGTGVTDADPGDTLTTTVTLSSGAAIPAWLSLNATTKVLSGTPADTDVGVLNLLVTHTDSQSKVLVQQLKITVIAHNDPPVLNHIDNLTATAGTPFVRIFSTSEFSDPDPGDTLTLEVVRLVNNQVAAFPAWLSYNQTTRTLSGTPSNSDAGGYTLRVTVRDAAGETDSQNVTLTVSAVEVNQAPVVNDQTFGLAAGANNGTLVGNVAATDANNDVLTYAITAGNANGAFAINASTGAITVADSADIVVGTQVLTVSVTDDGNPALSDTAQITINIAAASDDQVRISLRTFDTNGNQITTIDAGATFELRAFIQDIRATPTGVFSAFTDVTYTAALATVQGTITHSSTYGGGTAGNTTTAGLLDEVGGVDGTSPLGGSEFEIFRVRFTAANTAGVITFTADPADQAVQHPVLLFNAIANLDNSLIEFGSTTLAINGFGAPAGIGESNPLHNADNPFDVNGDSFVSPLDALIVINRLNASALPHSAEFVDVNDDGYATPIDALLVINHLNGLSRSAMGSTVTSDDHDHASAQEDLVDSIFAELAD